MPDHLEKFIFLGIVVALALLSLAAYPGTSRLSGIASGSPQGVASVAADVPLFVMGTSSASVTARPSANGAASAMLGGETVAAGNASVGSSTPSAAPSSSTAGSPFAEVGSQPAPAIVGESSLVADLETGTVYVGTNLDARWPLASVTKLMTASVVIDDMSMDQNVTVPPDAAAVDPSQQLLAAGETFTVSDLLHMLLLPSSNVAAEALADYYGRARFIAEMNARAASWGMTNTHYDDPSGLSAGNESTSNDLMKLAREIYAHYPQILATTRMPQVMAVDQSSGKNIAVRSINNFAGRADFIGGKTGYTDEAAGNLLSVFRYEGRPILIVVTGTSDDQRFDNTLALYDWFVQNYK